MIRSFGSRLLEEALEDVLFRIFSFGGLFMHRTACPRNLLSSLIEKSFCMTFSAVEIYLLTLKLNFYIESADLFFNHTDEM